MTIKLDKVLYTATATAHGGRDGKVTTDDSALNITVVPPKALGGSGAGTNPEQLFTAGYADCFGSALAHVARAKKIQTGPVSITAKVNLGPVGQGFGLSAELTANIPEMPKADAQALLEAAHQVCPYSNATRGNIQVDIRLG